MTNIIHSDRRCEVPVLSSSGTEYACMPVSEKVVSKKRKRDDGRRSGWKGTANLAYSTGVPAGGRLVPTIVSVCRKKYLTSSKEEEKKQPKQRNMNTARRAGGRRRLTVRKYR
jgi:hypothetical protein